MKILHRLENVLKPQWTSEQVVLCGIVNLRKRLQLGTTPLCEPRSGIPRTLDLKLGMRKVHCLITLRDVNKRRSLVPGAGDEVTNDGVHPTPCGDITICNGYSLCIARADRKWELDPDMLDRKKFSVLSLL